ncbi:putative ATP-binding cassette transporter [Hibiscus syriacus]|uniref:Conserved oligomeric Golgi complex subunit 6 n=1 Tax=Hibiscus syriacus TaxID=106335 RepID=A0A6A3CJL7_HIBSY|nr:putative ATP-binding cassette transporter [Hibiscus syriacus]
MVTGGLAPGLCVATSDPPSRSALLKSISISSVHPRRLNSIWIESRTRIGKALSSCSASTGDIIVTTERLKQEHEVTTQKQQIVSYFLRDYQLSPQEISALRDEELNDSFFKALSHVQEIHANFKILLRTHHQRAGFELMDMMAMYQEGAYERLCRFISALTRGGPGGMPRPIEVHAHDPLHPDALIETGSAANPFVSKNVENDFGTIEADFTFVPDRIFEGVCRPFKVRVEQVLQERNISLQSLWALKDAAQKTFFEILKSHGEKLLRYPPLVAVDLSPAPAVSEGVSVLLEIIDTYDSMMVPASGKKPAFFPVMSALIDPIIQMCEQAAEAHKSKGSGHSSRRSRMSSDSSNLSKSAVDAILSNDNSATFSQNSEAPSQIFLINCLCAIQQPFLGHEVAAEYSRKLSTMIDNHVNVLVGKEVDTMLGRCGLSMKMHHFRNSKDTSFGTSLAEIEDTTPASLSECLKAFFGFIFASESSLPEFEQMQVPKLRADACIQVARSLADTYERIYNAILDPKNKYPDPKSLARHPPDQIRTILGI